MPKKKAETKKENRPTAVLKVGTVFELPKEHIAPYQYISIISDKELFIQEKLVRECVAWNGERCRRYDTFEEELLTYKEIGKIKEDVDAYRRTTWEEPKVPQVELKGEK